MSWALLRQFPPLVWTVILGTFMVRTSYYMVWPFLSILLYREYGLSATAIGAMLAGCRHMFGYPITPSTEVAEVMAEELPLVGGKFIQMEDEIASMASIIGASWAGVRSMTATSPSCPKWRPCSPTWASTCWPRAARPATCASAVWKWKKWVVPRRLSPGSSSPKSRKWFLTKTLIVCV